MVFEATPQPVKPRALVVDDEAENRDLLGRILRNAGYTVDRASSGDDALPLLKSKTYGLIVSDQRMPGMSGTEFLVRAFESAPHAIRLLVSGYSDFEATIGAINEAAISGFIQKPYDAQQITLAIANAGKQRHLTVRHSELVAELEEATRRLNLDLDERTRTIQDSEKRLKELIGQLPEAIAVVRDGRLAFVNSGWVTYLGYHDASEVIGRPVEEFIPRDEQVILQRQTQRVFERQSARYLNDHRILRADGGQRVAELSVLNIDFDAQPSLLLVARDVTEQRFMQARLAHAERMASIGTLAAGVAHEINNPLSYIMANQSFSREVVTSVLETLRRIKSADGVEANELKEVFTQLEEVDEVLGEAHQGSERVHHVVRSLRSFANPVAESEMGPVDVNDALESTIKMAWNEIRHRAELVRAFDDGVPPVLATKTRLGQVFLNIIMNAAQAIEAGDVENNRIKISTSQDASGNVIVEIEDTGRGIPPEHIGRIYEPFFTTKPVDQGTGLGLSITYATLASIGGDISVQNGSKRGSIFRVTLPAFHEELAQVAEGKREPVKLDHSGRILVIDDEPAVASALQRMLQRWHTVDVEIDGRAGLQRILDDKSGYDVIFCDLMVPNITGMDIYEQIEKERPEYCERFVFMTGSAFTPRAKTFSESTKRPVLDKPFDVTEIRTMVAKFLENR